MDIQHVFSEKMKFLMEEKEISEAELSEALNLTASCIYKYLEEKGTPSVENAVKISDFFECSMDFLFGFTEEHENIRFKQSRKFCERFRELLKKHGLSREAFKREKLFAKQSIDDWFHGVRLPTIDNLIELKIRFNCTLDYLIGRD